MFFSLRFLQKRDWFFFISIQSRGDPFFTIKRIRMIDYMFPRVSSEHLHDLWAFFRLVSCVGGWGGCQGVRQHFLKFFCNVTYYFETLYKLTRILLTAANKRDMGNGLWPRLIFQANTISKNFNWKPFGQKLHQDIPPIFIYLELTEITTKFSNPEYFIKLGFTSIVQIFSYRN